MSFADNINSLASNNGTACISKISWKLKNERSVNKHILIPYYHLELTVNKTYFLGGKCELNKETRSDPAACRLLALYS